MIELIVQMSTFQRRFHWMLSALAQQSGNVPAFRLRVDTYAPDPYYDLNAGLAECFDDLLEIQWVEHDNGIFGQRGMLRDQALQQSNADWLVFTDADMLFPPAFLDSLASCYLDDGEFDEKFLGSYRIATTLAWADALMADSDFTKPIPDAFRTAHATWETEAGPCGRRVGTGYFQMTRRVEALKRGRYWQRTSGPRDVGLKDNAGGKYGSDVQFRKGWDITAVDLPPLLHLKHLRGWRGQWDGTVR